MKTMGTRSVVFVVGVMGLVLGMFACGSDKKSDDDSTSTTKLSFTDQINPILKASCSGTTGCHDVGTKESYQFVDKESTFKAEAASIKERLAKATTDSGYMPKAPATISADDKKKLLDFLAQ